jgi:hypothetical protein
MPSNITLPPWMLWTAVVLCATAAVGLFVGSRRARRRFPTITPVLTIQALPSPTHLPMTAPDYGEVAKTGSSRTTLSLPFMPAPAPLAPSLSKGQAEKRIDYRRAGNPILVLVADADTHRRPWNAWVIDRSRRGVRLAVEHQVKVGAVYTLRPAQAPPATPWSAVEVRHCAEVDGHWEVGCRFLQAPPVSILMLFG